MITRHSKPILRILTATALACGAFVAAAQETTWQAIFSIPVNNGLNVPAKAFIDDVNASCKGLLSIKLRGGPEVIPTNDQLNAIRRGVVQLYHGAAGYYEGQVPEVDALYGSNKTAMEQRRDGGIALLDEAFARVNAKYLAEFGSGFKFVIMTREKPKILPDGMVDLKGVKIRGTATYKGLYDRLGINRVALFAGEFYSALERGVVDGIGWTTSGITDSGWERFLKYRIHPYFMQGGFPVLANLEAYKKLTPQARECVEKKLVEHEAKAQQYFTEDAQRELEKMQKAGTEVIELQGEARKKYLQDFQDTHWKFMVEELKAPQAKVDQLRKAFFDPSRPVGQFGPTK
jgi:TRAP-type C4-dicarboxylate transport system substrate-binding protein